jgi:peptide/nickel transport system substrate-binding protein
VQFHLAIPYPPFLSTLAFTAASVIDPAPSSYRVTGRCGSTDLMANYCHDQLVGTGPFRLRVWQPNQQIILDRNDNYHRTIAPFKEIHILKANDVATRVLMLKAGDADTIELPVNHKDDIRVTPGGAVVPGISEYSGDTFVVQFLGFNQAINTAAAPPGDIDVPGDFFRDVSIRKAFSYAWDYDNFIQNVLFGAGSRLCGPVPSGMFGYDPTVPCYNRDLTQVQTFLDQALDPRTPAPTDTYWDNGFTVTIYYNIGNLVREEGARALQQTFSNINTNMRPGLPPISVRAQGLEWASFLQAVRDKTPALFFLGWAPDYADPDDYVVPFLRTGQFFPNRVSYSNTSLDPLIDQQAQELNPATRLQLLRDIQRTPYYDVPYIWLYQSQAYNVFRTWVTGYYSNEMTTAGTGNYYYDYNK